MNPSEKKQRRIRRHRRVRAKIQGALHVPRVVVFRSNKHVYAQVIDDRAGRVLVWASDRELQKADYPRRLALSQEVGKLLAKKARAQRITKVVFDRAGYAYHGNVKALAQGAREGGLQF